MLLERSTIPYRLMMGYEIPNQQATVRNVRFLPEVVCCPTSKSAFRNATSAM